MVLTCQITRPTVYALNSPAWNQSSFNPATRCSQTVASRVPPFELNLSAYQYISQVTVVAYRPYSPNHNAIAIDIICTAGAVSVSAPYRNTVSQGQCKTLTFNFNPPVLADRLSFTSNPISGSNHIVQGICTVHTCIVPSTISNCKVTVNATGVNLRRGPSIDDLSICMLTQGNEFDARAKATDEDGQLWYGVVDAINRPGYLSWVSANFSSLSPCDISALADRDFSTSTSSDQNWEEALVFTNKPLNAFATNDPNGNAFRGFGFVDSDAYSTIPLCAHPGMDFFPSSGDAAGTSVLAAVSGTIVGMGKYDPDPVKIIPPATWGAVGGGYNIIIRTGRHYVLYGHLESIEPYYYLGAYVYAGERIGSLAVQPSNTHLHLEVRDFATADFTPPVPVRPRFGAVNSTITTGRNPSLATDPILFLPSSQQGSFNSTDNEPTCTNEIAPEYALDRYNGASIGGASFNYTVRSDLRLKCFNLINGGAGGTEPGFCISPRP